MAPKGHRRRSGLTDNQSGQERVRQATGGAEQDWSAGGVTSWKRGLPTLYLGNNYVYQQVNGSVGCPKLVKCKGGRTAYYYGHYS